MSRFRGGDIPLYVRDHYIVDGEIAKGKYGVVYRCKEKSSSGRDVAIKLMLKRHNKKDDVEKEVAIMKRLDHPNLLCFVDYVPDVSNYILVTELLNGGELFDYCITNDYLVESEAVFFMKQILSGLSYMHSKSICHLDLKPENIVLKSRETKEIKIIDFGTCQDLSENKTIKAMMGTPEFISPEALNYDPITCAADMWAIGVITFCLLTGCSPFLGENDAETMQNITDGEYEFPEPDPAEGYDDITPSAKDFISQLLIHNPRKRMTSSSALTHSWIFSQSLSRAASRISTDRLKKLRRRRKLLAAIQAVRLSVGLLRSFSKPYSVSVSESTSQDDLALDDHKPRRGTDPTICSNITCPSPSSSPSDTVFNSPLSASFSSKTLPVSPMSTETANGHF